MGSFEPLQYRWGEPYAQDVGTYQDQVKDGLGGCIPIAAEVHRGDYEQLSGGHNWWGESGFGELVRVCSFFVCLLHKSLS